MWKKVLMSVAVAIAGCGSSQTEEDAVAPVSSVAQELSRETDSADSVKLVYDNSINVEELKASLRASRTGADDTSDIGHREANRTWPWGGGDVYWQISGAYYAGYTVLPEDAGYLAFPGGFGSSQEVDALYNRSWGCYKALKIPDDCIAVVYGSTINWSCDLYPVHSVRWVVPGTGEESAWPRCPG